MKTPHKPIALLSVFAIFLFGLPPAPLHAWGEHALGSYPALEAMAELKDAPAVPVESLEQFLAAESEAIARTLAQEEERARRMIPEYPPLPDALRYDAATPANQRKERFIAAIRINQRSKLAYYTQHTPGENPEGCDRMAANEVTPMERIEYMAGIRFCRLSPGQSVAPIAVIATASDEPDWGMDVGLFENNNTPMSAVYAFGEQPFGNPELEYSSQAPFHMGFFHESGIVYTLAAFLKRTYPEYRAGLYLALSRTAFETGHDYWGYRFLGWGLHYVQDLTQPYHARVLPDVSVGRMLWVNLLNIVGAGEAQKQAVQLVSNRHLSLEDFQKRLMRREYAAGNRDHVIFRALRDTSGDAAYGQYSESYLRETLTVESEDRADDLDEILSEAMPSRIVQDGTYNYDSGPDPEILFRAIAAEQKETERLMTEPLAELFQSFGAHTRIYTRAALSARR